MSAGKPQWLEFHFRHTEFRKNPFTQYSIVCCEMRAIRTHAIHNKIRTEKQIFNGGINFRILQIESRLGFVSFFCSLMAGSR